MLYLPNAGSNKLFVWLNSLLIFSFRVPALTTTLALIAFLIANEQTPTSFEFSFGVRNQILLPCAAIKAHADLVKNKSRGKKKKYGETSHFCDIFGTGLCGR